MRLAQVLEGHEPGSGLFVQVVIPGVQPRWNSGNNKEIIKIYKYSGRCLMWSRITFSVRYYPSNVALASPVRWWSGLFNKERIRLICLLWSGMALSRTLDPNNFGINLRYPRPRFSTYVHIRTKKCSYYIWDYSIVLNRIDLTWSKSLHFHSAKITSWPCVQSSQFRISPFQAKIICRFQSQFCPSCFRWRIVWNLFLFLFC